jgi:uncharacterized protein with HEPN domain
VSDSDRIHLAEMIEAAERIASYIADLDEAGFLASALINDAVSLNLLVIGEGASHLSQKLRLLDPETPWLDLAGLRNRIAHGYARVDLRIVWRIVQTDLPPLKTRLERLKDLV